MHKKVFSMCLCFAIAAYFGEDAVVCFRAQAQYGHLPAPAIEALQRYSKLDAATWSWKGSLSYSSGGKRAKYIMQGSYVRVGNKFTWSESISDGKTPKSSDRLVKFDGRTLAQSNYDVQMNWYDIEKLSNSQPQYFNFQVPYFDAVGIHYPKKNGDLAKGPFKSKILHALENGANLVRCVEERVGDKRILVVELESAHEAMYTDKTNLPDRDRWLFHLSIDEDYAVIKHERRTPTGKLWLESSVSSISRLSSDLPLIGQNATMKIFINLKETDFQIATESNEVVAIAATNPRLLATSDDDFVLKKESARAGAELIDAVTPELQNANGTVSVFAMPASADDLDKAIAAASVKRSLMPRVAWFLGLTLLIGGGVALYLRFKKSH